MPAGAQSLQAFIPTVYTTQSATAYKGNLDGNSSIVGNPSGMFYVYPQQPATMTVNIDKGFTYVNTSVGHVLNNGAAAATVALVAPGSNSYYGTIYYEALANTFGVIYGASGASPTPVLPDMLTQIPLALALITSTTTTIQATNLTDARWVDYLPLGKNVGALAVNTAYNLMGASRFDINFAITAAITLTLNNISMGAPVTIRVTNTSGGALVLKVAATAPSTTAYTVFGDSAANAVNLVSTGYSVPNNSTHTIMLNNPAQAALYALFGPIV